MIKVGKLGQWILFCIYETYENIFRILYGLYLSLPSILLSNKEKYSLAHKISPEFNVRTIWNKAFSPFGNNLFLFKNRKGQVMAIRLSSYDDVVALLGRFEEKPMESLFVNECRKGKIIMDVGAHIGRYTLIASLCVGDSGKIIACEPHPANYSLLMENSYLNKCTNVIAKNIALAAEDGFLNLLEGTDSGLHSIVGDLPLIRNSLRVRSSTIDSLLSELRIETVDLCKIDVEGAELLVLKGGVESLKQRKIRKILCEVHPNVQVDEVTNFLKRQGYATETIGNFVFSHTSNCWWT